MAKKKKVKMLRTTYLDLFSSFSTWQRLVLDKRCSKIRSKRRQKVGVRLCGYLLGGIYLKQKWVVGYWRECQQRIEILGTAFLFLKSLEGVKGLKSFRKRREKPCQIVMAFLWKHQTEFCAFGCSLPFLLFSQKRGKYRWNSWKMAKWSRRDETIPRLF